MTEPAPDTRLSEWTKNPALGAVAIVAVLAAVGIAGDLLPRLVRNQPVLTAVTVAAAVLSVFVLFLRNRYALLVGTVALAAALVGVVALGVVSQTDREIPQVSLGVTRDAATSVNSLTVVAGSVSQRTQETMLVQVLGFPTALDAERLKAACLGSRREFDERDDDFSVLLWNETGPDQAGKSTVETTLDVTADEFAVVCVTVLLIDRDSTTPDDDRFAWTYTTLS